MKKSEVEQLSNEELLDALVQIEGIAVTQANFRSGGSTKKTQKEYLWILEQCALRFNLDMDKLKNFSNFGWLWEEEK